MTFMGVRVGSRNHTSIFIGRFIWACGGVHATFTLTLTTCGKQLPGLEAWERGDNCARVSARGWHPVRRQADNTVDQKHRNNVEFKYACKRSTHLRSGTLHLFQTQSPVIGRAVQEKGLRGD